MQKIIPILWENQLPCSVQTSQNNSYFYRNQQQYTRMLCHYALRKNAPLVLRKWEWKYKKTKHTYFTFNFENSRCEATLAASFLLWLVTETFSYTPSPVTLASTEKVLASLDVKSSNSKLWDWQSSCKSLTGLSCKLDENFMIGSKNDVIIFQTLFKSNPESRRTAPIQDSTKSPKAWNNP